MAKKILALTLVFLLVATLVTFYLRSKKAPQEKEIQRSLESGSILVQLSQKNDSGQDGEAILTDTSEGLSIIVEISPPSLPYSQPANIHKGTCSDLGDVFYELGIVEGGFMEILLDTDLDSLSQKTPLAINVVRSETQKDIRVACGDIIFK